MKSAAVFHGAERAARISFIVGGLGLLACLFGAIFDTTQFLRSYLWAYWFWLGASIGCGLWLMMYQLTGGAWGFVTQRIFEAGIRVMPVYFILVIPIVIGIPKLYAYANPQMVAADKALQHKAAYLNTPFVIVRLAIYFALWFLVGWLMTRWSLRQDETGDMRYHVLRSRLAGPGIIISGIAITFMSVDWIMALEPDWYSTMFPGFYIVGMGLTAIAIAIFTLRYASHHGPLAELASPKDFHDLGNLLFANVVFWAYVQVSQLIITWNGNTPKEIQWYLHRTQGNWAWLTFAIALFHFGLPFFILLGRRNKLQAQRLAFIAAFIVVVHAVDNYWNVEPAFHREHIYFSWLDAVAPIGLGGIWAGLFLKQLRKYPLIPLNSPRLAEALEKL
jgi:hypothetical protein